MKHIVHSLRTAAGLALACLALNQCASGPTTSGASASKISADSRTALNDLYAQNSKAKELGRKAKGILVFPQIAKGGFIVGGMGGNGAMIRPDGSIREYYQTGGLSFGLQAGLQSYGFALFLMDQSALDNVNRAGGVDTGSTPNLVVMDKGAAKTVSTASVDRGTYAFVFDQSGLMGGIDLQGSKITRIHPGP